MKHRHIAHIFVLLDRGLHVTDEEAREEKL